MKAHDLRGAIAYALPIHAVARGMNKFSTVHIVSPLTCDEDGVIPAQSITLYGKHEELRDALLDLAAELDFRHKETAK